MRTLPLRTLAVSLRFFPRKIRDYFRPEPAWKKADDLPDAVPPKATQPAEVPVAQTVSDVSGKGLWDDCSYCWVVVCKNHWFHRKGNPFNVYRIPLGETDAVSTRPAINQHFVAQCDKCFREYVYKPSDVLRWEMEPPSSFVPHPLFRE